MEPIRTIERVGRRESFAVLALAACLVAASVALVAPRAGATPFIPADDNAVLERVPGRATAQYRELKALQVASAQAPSDPGRATALAGAYVRQSRVEGDPRFLGYAQAALAPWWKDPSAPTPVLMLRATILQSSHQFDAAVADLDRVTQRDPANAQALLTRATVLTVQGKYPQARADCDALQRVVHEIYPIACAAAIDSVTGNAPSAYERLGRALEAAPRLDPSGRAWVQTLLGEIADRQGSAAAEGHFKAALSSGQRDLYLLAAYSDWLLDHGRAGEVVALLRSETRVDPLLLRLALAQQAMEGADGPGARASIDMLRARFDASRARGDTLHLRENARYELYLRGNAVGALALALDNWKLQREPADLRILAEAATAAKDAAATGLVKQWLAQTGFEYPAVATRVGAGAASK